MRMPRFVFVTPLDFANRDASLDFCLVSLTPSQAFEGRVQVFDLVLQMVLGVLQSQGQHPRRVELVQVLGDVAGQAFGSDRVAPGA